MFNESDSVFVGERIHPAVEVILASLGFLVLFCGVFGNGFLLLVLGTQRSLWQVHNVFIANLALADLIVICTGLPFVTLDFTLGHYPVVSAFHCELNGFVVSLAYSVSVLSLVSVSFNRYMKVCHSQLFLRLFSLRKSIAACSLLWLASLVMNIPLLAGKPPYGYDRGSHHCNARPEPRSLDLGSLGMATLLVLPTLAITFFNIAIFRHWRQSTRRLKPLRSNENTKPCASEHELFPGDSGRKNNVLINTTHDKGSSASSSEIGAKPRAHPEIPEIRVNVADSPASSQLDLVHFGHSADQKGSLAVLFDPRFLRRKRSSTDQSIIGDKPSGQRQKTSGISGSEMALIRSLLVIAVCLVVLYTPFAVCIVVDHFVAVRAEVMATASALLFVNCAINWIVYGAMNTSFRKAYRLTALTCWPWARRQNLPATDPDPNGSYSKGNNLTDNSNSVSTAGQTSQTTASEAGNV